MPKTRTTPPWLSALFWLVMVAVLGCTIEGALRYQRDYQRYQDEQSFYRQLEQVQQPGANVELSTLETLRQQGQQMQLTVANLDYQILYRKWLAALANFETLTAGAENRYVSRDLDQLREEVQQSLLHLRSACDQQLRGSEQGRADNTDQRWAMYNLRGTVAVMMAYTLIEFSQDSDKSHAFLGDAVEDFKYAIRAVDQRALPPAQRMVPRWNLELIVGSGESLMVGRTLSGDSVDAVRQQLQAVLPNVGGYASGTPIETQVRK
jgi:hypothetical protein